MIDIVIFVFKIGLFLFLSAVAAHTVDYLDKNSLGGLEKRALWGYRIMILASVAYAALWLIGQFL